jgi:hypothetical protein
MAFVGGEVRLCPSVESRVGEAYEDLRCRAAAFSKMFMNL